MSKLREVVMELMSAEISDYTTNKEQEEEIIQRGMTLLRKFIAQERTIGSTIRRLRLKPGDIIVVRDPQVAHNIEACQMHDVMFNVPILIAPEGIKRVPRKYLLKILGLKEDL